MFTFPRDLIIYLNIVLVVWALIEIYRGYKRGFILQIVDFFGTIVALFGAWLFSEPLARVFKFVAIKGVGYSSIDQVINLQVNRLIWVVVLFIAIRLALLLITPIASFISKMPLIKQVNSSVGGVVSILVFAIKVFLIVVFLSFPVVKNGQQIIEGTWLTYVSDISVPVFSFIEDTVNKNVAIQSILSNRELSKKQSDAMVEWLTSKGFTSGEVADYLNKNHE